VRERFIRGACGRARADSHCHDADRTTCGHGGPHGTFFRAARYEDRFDHEKWC
jgi:hypothetical protein